VAERLQKYLAAAGIGSRRACEELIRAGRVTVDGSTAVLGMSVDPARQTVRVDGRPVARETLEYWLLNKAAGVLSAAVDQRGRRTVVDCVPTSARVFPVGRLDLGTTGLVLLTNDGELASRLLHPRYHVDKEYIVTVRGLVNRGEVEALRTGGQLEDGLTAPAAVEVLRTPPRRQADPKSQADTTVLRMTIHEGRKRQIRRMMEAVGHKVLALHRSRFDGLSDAGLSPGECRRLSLDEVERLRKTAFGG